MLTTDRVAGSALVIVGVFALSQSLQLPLGSLRQPGPAYMPAVLALLLVVFGVAVAALGGGSGRFADVSWHEWRHALAIFGACAFAAWGLERLGYRLTTGLVLAFLLGLLERKHPLLTAVLVVAVAGGSFWLFNTLLRVPLPRGPFGV
jgi:putative tricarboxylic transport membrane protein